MPPIPIIICTIFIFLSLFLAVLSTFLALVFTPSCLPFAFSYLYYLTTLLSLPLVLELGRRLRCREQTAHSLRFPASPHICFVLYLYDFILYSMLHTLPPPTPFPRVSLEFVPISRFCTNFVPVGLIIVFVLFGFLRFSVHDRRIFCTSNTTP